MVYDSNGYCVVDCKVIGDVELVPLWKSVKSSGKKENSDNTTKTIKKWIGNVKYSLTGNSAKVIKLKSVNSIVIPSSIKSNGRKYKVTAFVSGSCSGCKKIKKLIIKGKKLKVNKLSFKGLKKGTKLVVSKSAVKSYKKLVKSLNLKVTGK